MRKRKTITKFAAGFMAATLVVGNMGVTVYADEFTSNEIVTEETETNLGTDVLENGIGTVADVPTEKTSSELGISDVVLNVGCDESEINITWTSNSENSYIKYASGYEGESFPNEYIQTKASSKETIIDGTYSHSCTITEIEAGKTYAYMLGVENKEENVEWSTECYTFKGNDTESGYEFLVVGDPQIGSSDTEKDTTNWENTMKTALSQFENVSFLLSVGDQINSSRNNDTKAEENFDGFLSEEASLSSIPLASSVGNHDNSHASLYTSHFTLPNVSEYGNTSDTVTGEEDYSFTYGNTLFMMINTNNSSIAEHKAFIEKTISENKDCKWRVVAFHQSIYSVASHVNDGNIADLRVGLSPVFAENDIDIVLMGHDHVYARSYIMGGVTGMQAAVTEEVEEVIENPDGVQYITFNSGSGSKHYNITQELYKYTAVQNQEYTPNYSHVTVTDESFTVTTYRTTDNTVVDTVTIRKTDDKADVLTEEVPFTDTTKTVELETKEEGYDNEMADITVEKTAGYDSGVKDADGGTAEIVQYNSDTKNYYVVNGKTGTLDIVPRETYEENGKTGVKCDIKSALAKLRPDFTYGDMTSIAVSTKTDLIAIAVQAEDTLDKGLIVLMNYDNEIVAVVGAGVQPDMVTFTEDGTKVLSANEGEPRDGYTVESESDTETAAEMPAGPGFPGAPGAPGGSQTKELDPAGTITIVDLSDGVTNITTQEVTFEKYDDEAERTALVETGVIIKKDTKPSLDFEPEYIAVSGNTAYVTLQEANAIAVIDIEKAEVTAINSLGFKNHNLEKNALDLTADGEINIETQNVYGIYMPDAISTYAVNGITYLVTANEGDSREWGEEDTDGYHCNEAKTKEITGEKVTIFDQNEYDGLDADKTYIFGGRSFSIYAMNADGTMTQVYDSGSDFETITSEIEGLQAYFNCSNDDIELDSRSGKKGPEAEGIVVGQIGEKTYAFIGLERIGGVMIYDITDPVNSTYVNYINTRDFSVDIAGDVSPEGLAFVAASESVSGNAELIVANEVSGTVAIYEMTEKEDENTDVKEDDQNSSEKTESSEEIESSQETVENTEKEENSNADIPETGDKQNAVVWVVFGLISILATGVMVFSRKRNF